MIKHATSRISFYYLFVRRINFFFVGRDFMVTYTEYKNGEMTKIVQEY